jgi:hypothetical protein
MKTSVSIASHNESLALATTAKFTPSVNKTPFADLMLHPEKLEAALKIAKRENDAFEASLTFSRNTINPAARVVSPANMRRCQSSGDSRSELKMTEFHLEAPFAKSVKLAADFTEWEKFPLDLMKAEDGLWFITVPLPLGYYSYRFIVDGQWHDDPRPNQCSPNSFGTVNAIVKVR